MSSAAIEPVVFTPFEGQSLRIGPDQPLLLLAGPCVLESEALAREIATERDRLSLGMSPEETEILDSFLEARKGYLDAFFDEAERTFGTLEAYIETGLRLTPAHQERLSELLAGR